jgi:hypothetical protein
LIFCNPMFKIGIINWSFNILFSIHPKLIYIKVNKGKCKVVPVPKHHAMKVYKRHTF